MRPKTGRLYSPEGGLFGYNAISWLQQAKALASHVNRRQFPSKAMGLVARPFIPTLSPPRDPPESMNANQLLDRHYLEVRARLLEIAATLDRIDRAKASTIGASVSADDSAQPIDADPRMTQLKQGIELLLSEGDGRAAKVQQLFSLNYDPEWRSRYQL